MAAGVVIVWSGWAPTLRVLALPATIGRDQFPDDDQLSRAHCSIRQVSSDSPVFEIVDLGSRNGTFVVHERVTHGAYGSGVAFRAGQTVGVVVADTSDYIAGRPPASPVAPPDVTAAVLRAVARARAGIRIHATAVEWYLWRRWPDVAAIESHAAAAVLLAESELRPEALWKVEVPRLPPRPGMQFVWSGRDACNVVCWAPATIGRAQLPHDDALPERHLELAADRTVTTVAPTALRYISMHPPVLRIGNSIGWILDDVNPDRGLATSLLVSVAHELGVEDQLDANIAEWFLRESRWNRAELRKALMDRLAGITVETFAELFERIMKAPVPFSIPASYEVLSSRQISGKEAELMIGSGTGTTLLVQADANIVRDAPVGWFQAGFWGHGVNSYAFYYGRVTERARIYLRLRYGEGAYVKDPEAHRAHALETLQKCITLESLPCKHVTVIQSMEYVYWRIERLDGSVAEIGDNSVGVAWDLRPYDFEAIAKGET
jgi:hypothetical protein